MIPSYHSKIVALNQTPRKPSEDLKKIFSKDLISDFGGGAMSNPIMKFVGKLMKVETKPGLSGGTPESSAEHALANAPMAYAKVIQANDELYEKKTMALPAPAVFLTISDQMHSLDVEKLDEILDKISAAREGKPRNGEEQRFVDLLDNPDSTIKMPVPMSLTGGIKAWAWDKILDPDEIEGGFIQDNTIFPGLVVDMQGQTDFYFVPKKKIATL